MDPRLHTELWTSWASLLRSYAAAHGMNSVQHAVVEVGPELITVRVGSRWMRFMPTSFETDEHGVRPFTLTEEGSILFEPDEPEEMDFAAERLMRELMFV